MHIDLEQGHNKWQEVMCGVAFIDNLLKSEFMWGKNLKEIWRVDYAQLPVRQPPYCSSGEASWMGETVGCSFIDFGVSHIRGLMPVAAGY